MAAAEVMLQESHKRTPEQAPLVLAVMTRAEGVRVLPWISWRRGSNSYSNFNFAEMAMILSC